MWKLQGPKINVKIARSKNQSGNCKVQKSMWKLQGPKIKVKIARSKNQGIQAHTPSTRVSTIDLTFQDLSCATIFRILYEFNLFSNKFLKSFTLLNPPILIPIILLHFSQIMQQGPRNNQLKMASQLTKKLTISSSEIPLTLFPPIFDCIFFPRPQMWHSRLARNFRYWRGFVVAFSRRLVMVPVELRWFLGGLLAGLLGAGLSWNSRVFEIKGLWIRNGKFLTHCASGWAPSVQYSVLLKHPYPTKSSSNRKPTKWSPSKVSQTISSSQQYSTKWTLSNAFYFPNEVSLHCTPNTD